MHSCENGVYMIKNAGWNADLAVNGSVEFGVSCNENFVNFPESCTLVGDSEKTAEDDYSVEYYVDSDWGSGFSGRMEITNNTDMVIEDWILEFDFDREITNIWNAVVESHEGSHYVIKNAGYNSNISVGQTISIGFNGQSGTVETVPDNYQLYSFTLQEEAVDMEADKDSDGVPDYIEEYFGMDKDKEDTDGDALSDYMELFELFLDPSLMDTDGNGINDGDEDIDEDGLSNLEEIEIETNPLLADTDEDGLTDGEENDIYGTESLIYDTDEDDMCDGDEVALGLDPLRKDSDGNGVFDSEEILEQNFSSSIEDDNNIIEYVEVKMACNGLLDKQIEIESVMEKDVLSSGVVGLVGEPFSIETDVDFDTAVITVKYDKAQLGEHKEEDLCFAWYNEETGEYHLEETATVLDKENQILSCQTNHFSTWLVLDKDEWNNALEEYYKTAKAIHFNDYQYMLFEVDGVMHRYQLFEKRGVWGDAKELCELAGGYLATIQSEEENQAVFKYIIEQGCKSAYIGLSDEVVEGTWKWSNGEQVEYTNWHSGEPNGNRRENYAMYYYKYPTGKWNDGSFNSGNTQNDVSIFVCEWDNVDTEGDRDKDGIPDYYETNGMIIQNNNIVFTDPDDEDTDDDGLLDSEELIYMDFPEKIFEEDFVVPVWFMKSNPNLVDSDGDSYNDDEEKSPLEMAEHSDLFCKKVTEFNKEELYSDKRAESERNFGNEYKEGSFLKKYTYKEAKETYDYCKDLVDNGVVNFFVFEGAVSNLEHYLDATGTEADISVDGVIASSVFIETELSDFDKKLKEHVESIYLPGVACEVRLRNYYLFQDYTDLSNIINTLGSPFDIIAYGKLYGYIEADVVTNGDKQSDYIIKRKIRFFDYYDWDKNVDAAFAFMLPSDDEMQSLEQYAMAKAFLCYGEKEEILK